MATGSPLDFENLFDFDQMQLSEDSGVPAFTSDQFAAPQPSYPSNVDVEFPLEPALSGAQPHGNENGFMNPFDLQQIQTPDENPLFDVTYPAPAASLAQPYYSFTPIPAQFVPPQTPPFAQGPYRVAQLGAWYSQAAQYYQFRANLYSADDGLPEIFPIRADGSDEIDHKYSQQAITAHMNAACTATSSASQELQASRNRSGRSIPARKRADTAPAHRGSLCHMLAREKVIHEPAKQSEAQLERGAKACSSKHTANLEIENADRGAFRRTNRGTKRKHESKYEEGSEDEELKAPAPKKKAKRPAKPVRAVSEVYELDSDEESDDLAMEDNDDEYVPEPEPIRGRKSRWEK